MLNLIIISSGIITIAMAFLSAIFFMKKKKILSTIFAFLAIVAIFNMYDYTYVEGFIDGFRAAPSLENNDVYTVPYYPGETEEPPIMYEI